MLELLKLVSKNPKTSTPTEKNVNIETITNLITNKKDDKNSKKVQTPDVSVYMDMTKEMKERRKGKKKTNLV